MPPPQQAVHACMAMRATMHALPPTSIAAGRGGTGARLLPLSCPPFRQLMHACMAMRDNACPSPPPSHLNGCRERDKAAAPGPLVWCCWLAPVDGGEQLLAVADEVLIGELPAVGVHLAEAICVQLAHEAAEVLLAVGTECGVWVARKVGLGGGRRTSNSQRAHSRCA